ncbi:vWA domain-containing protein [Ponticaulis profundi]|uniref:von Willebrand factor type A domain-containing protein n=1 Tax=Ponticaulis profundi TaxID=2665222 RepID=A0ABW1S648_9PROT
MQRAVSPSQAYSPTPMPIMEPPPVDRERYEDVDDNPVKRVADEPVSTFSVDVDTASYARTRRFLTDGTLPPKDAVRVEELINYFDYSYPLPEAADPPFSTNVSVVPSPWKSGNELIQIGLQGYNIEADERPAMNLTLLVDVSGSMSSPDKLPLAKKALGMLVDNMSEKDTISVAVYAGAAGMVLEPTPGNEKSKIMAALEGMAAGGSTAGGEGLRLAYSLAEQNFDEDSVNRVMLLTDGDFNVGVTSDERLEDFVSRKRDSGVFLSVMGFGRGNYNDAMMQKIAQAGNGMAAYVDTVNEARKLLNDDLSGSLFTIAKDVKIQVEFNPAKVSEYRLIGYETRMLEEADFNNDKVDAGEIGAGHTVTALYEVTPVDADSALTGERRYEGNKSGETNADPSAEYGFLKLRYKLPDEDTSKLIEVPITNDLAFETLDEAPLYTRFATAVAGFGQLLKGSSFISDDFDYDSVIELALDARGEDAFGYRSEFVQLARSAKTAAAQETLEQKNRGGD